MQAPCWLLASKVRVGCQNRAGIQEAYPFGAPCVIQVEVHELFRSGVRCHCDALVLCGIALCETDLRKISTGLPPPAASHLWSLF